MMRRMLPCLQPGEWKEVQQNRHCRRMRARAAARPDLAVRVRGERVHGAHLQAAVSGGRNFERTGSCPRRRRRASRRRPLVPVGQGALLRLGGRATWSGPAAQAGPRPPGRVGNLNYYGVEHFARRPSCRETESACRRLSWTSWATPSSSCSSPTSSRRCRQVQAAEPEDLETCWLGGDRQRAGDADQYGQGTAGAQADGQWHLEETYRPGRRPRDVDSTTNHHADVHDGAARRGGENICDASAPRAMYAGLCLQRRAARGALTWLIGVLSRYLCLDGERRHASPPDHGARLPRRVEESSQSGRLSDHQSDTRPPAWWGVPNPNSNWGRLLQAPLRRRPLVPGGFSTAAPLT